jgi:hypothetical protein
VSKQYLDIERIEKLDKPMPSIAPQLDDLTTEAGSTNKLTIANTPTATVRCMGRLSCDCGARIRALDYQIEAADGGISRVELVCPGCEKDLFEVESC